MPSGSGWQRMLRIFQRPVNGRCGSLGYSSGRGGVGFDPLKDGEDMDCHVKNP